MFSFLKGFIDMFRQAENQKHLNPFLFTYHFLLFMYCTTLLLSNPNDVLKKVLLTKQYQYSVIMVLISV